MVEAISAAREEIAKSANFLINAKLADWEERQKWAHIGNKTVQDALLSELADLDTVYVFRRQFAIFLQLK